MSWTEGYVAGIDYVHSYHRELSPGMLRLACLSAAIAPPPSGPLRYLELGYGQGLSINIHAASVGGEFWGTDFNPAHAAQAQSLAAASGSGAKLLEDSLAELAARTDLPEFDIIALHGLWTWVSDENRRVIVDILRRRLRVGGLVYVSYNALPGWSAKMPLRHLLTLHSEIGGSRASDVVGKIDDALAFAQKVVDAKAIYFLTNQSAPLLLKSLTTQNRNYLAHEYFNRDWEPMAFSDLVHRLEAAKLSFATSANLLDRIDSLHLTSEAQKLLADIPNPIFRQTVRDYFVNQQFRHDIFVKGPRRLSPPEQLEAVQAQRIVLRALPEAIPFKVRGAFGDVGLNEDLYRAVIEVLAERAFAPKAIAEFADHPKTKAIPLPTIYEAIGMLVGAGHADPAQEMHGSVKSHSNALNRHLCERARMGAEIAYLASPTTGGGILVPRFHQLLMLCIKQGKTAPAEQAQVIWKLLASQGQRLQKGEATLNTPEENIAELTEQADQFKRTLVPLMRALGLM